MITHGTSHPHHRPPDEERRVVVVKGGQRWTFRWWPGGESIVARTAMDLARRPGSGFGLVDATAVFRAVTDVRAPA